MLVDVGERRMDSHTLYRIHHDTPLFKSIWIPNIFKLWKITGLFYWCFLHKYKTHTELYVLHCLKHSLNAPVLYVTLTLWPCPSYFPWYITGALLYFFCPMSSWFVITNLLKIRINSLISSQLELAPTKKVRSLWFSLWHWPKCWVPY